uniref:hydroxysqualene dehydroxylase n=1 Tax=Haloprofundus sp. MHR1 TaxID=2572921 RepID=UPI001F1FA6B7|nr:FAD-dependent oxidoreductase [Haloprofundus sp. MHR1]
MTQTVAILGGGIGGLSAAHELIKRGFEVTVYEAKNRFGGKARSIPISEEAQVLGEHGFRFFPGFYRHITDTMSRIPYGEHQTVADNLVPTSQSLLARATGETAVASTKTPETIDEWIETLRPGNAANSLSGSEARFFAERMLTLLTSCDKRRVNELENISWWDYIEAERMSEAYQQLAAVTQLLVALRPQDGSARTFGQIYFQLIRAQLDPSMEAERILNGPTSKVWIEPWVTYLEDKGVQFVRNAPVTAINCTRKQVTSVTISRAGSTEDVQADYYVAALPVEAMVELLTEELRRGAPSLARLDRIETGWMSGIQFYLSEDIPLVHGHQLYLDSPWALTSISQQQFWKEYTLSGESDGAIDGVLSVIISDWDKPGILYEKPARDCTPDEIKVETWTQLKAHLNRNGTERLSDDVLVESFLNPAIEETDAGVVNREPLLVNTAGSLRYRPRAATELKNFLLSADYVRTNTDLASMESANEAARRATNAILERSGVRAPMCEIWELEEPRLFKPLKAQDAIRYRLGLPHPGQKFKGISTPSQMLSLRGR